MSRDVGFEWPQLIIILLAVLLIVGVGILLCYCMSEEKERDLKYEEDEKNKKEMEEEKKMEDDAENPMMEGEMMMWAIFDKSLFSIFKFFPIKKKVFFSCLRGFGVLGFLCFGVFGLVI